MGSTGRDPLKIFKGPDVTVNLGGKVHTKGKANETMTVIAEGHGKGQVPYCLLVLGSYMSLA